MMSILLNYWPIVLVTALVPITGTAVRFRVHYNPKDLQVESKGKVQPPVISSFSGMIRRVHKIEGWAGLYKGLMPTLLTYALFRMFLLSVSNLIGTYNTADPFSVNMLVYRVFLAILFIPQVIITDRAMTTPHKLPYFNAMHSFRILLTTAERRRPWILYLTPGLLAAQIARTAYSIVLLWLISQLILPELANPGTGLLINLVVVAILRQVVIIPFETIITRLSIQRNDAGGELNPLISQEVGENGGTTKHASAGEDVIRLRMEPYVGLVDCVRKIIDEEGWSALYRAWWLLY